MPRLRSKHHKGCCRRHAGLAEELGPVIEALEREGVFVRKLHTNGVAFHSPLLDGCLDALKAGGPMVRCAAEKCHPASSGAGCIVYSLCGMCRPHAEVSQ